MPKPERWVIALLVPQPDTSGQVYYMREENSSKIKVFDDCTKLYDTIIEQGITTELLRSRILQDVGEGMMLLLPESDKLFPTAHELRKG